MPQIPKTVKILWFTSFCVFLWVLYYFTVSPHERNPHISRGIHSPEKIIIISSSEIQTKFRDDSFWNCDSESPREPFKSAEWQKVDSSQTFATSAFYDTRYQFDDTAYHYIRVLVSSRDDILENKSLFCYMWYDGSLRVVSSEVEEIWSRRWDNPPQNGTYHSYILSCPLYHNQRPQAISLSFQRCSKPANYLRIQVPLDTPRKSFAVCVKNLNFLVDISSRLIEWIELNLELGAQEIFIYYLSIHPNIRKVLEYYAAKKLVIMIPTTLPGSQPNGDYRRTVYLQENPWQKRRQELISYNDCLYRNIYKYEFIVPIDIDEIIVPVKSATWLEMMTNLKSSNPAIFGSFASLSVQNSYFFGILNGNGNSLFKQTIRSANFSIPGHAVKSFILTNSTKAVFNHYSLIPLYKRIKSNIILPTYIAQMNHYKETCPKHLLKQCRNKFWKYTLEDNILEKYASSVTQRVSAVKKALDLI